MPFASVSKWGFYKTWSYENNFDLYENKPVVKTHSHQDSFWHRLKRQLRNSPFYVTKLMVCFVSFSIVNVQSTLRRNLTLMQGGTFGRGESTIKNWLSLLKSLILHYLILGCLSIVQLFWHNVVCEYLWAIFVVTFILC